jgi:hypothetical protein
MGAKDGANTMLVVGGANADQVRYQRFGLTDYQTKFTFKFLGGVAAYHNTFGFYTYDIDAVNPMTAPLTLTPLFTRHDDPLGSEVEVTVDPGQYLGFYLVADGGQSPKGTFYSETARNSGLDSTQHHFLLLDSIVSNIAGYTIAVEDLPLNPGTGLMGDSDYNDLFVQMRFEQIIPPPPPVDPDNDPIATPEPASMGLALMGLTALTLRATRRPRRQH